MDKFNLEELADEKLDEILAMDQGSQNLYIGHLITDHYKSETLSQDMIEQLHIAYMSSFVLEKLLRQNEWIFEGFIPTYTNTGLIREFTNNIYYNNDNLRTH